MISMRKIFGDKFKVDLRKISIYPYLIAVFPVFPDLMISLMTLKN